MLSLSKRKHPVKPILVLLILFSVIAWLPVRAELTETDLEKIRQIFQDELGKPAIDPIDTNLDEIATHFDGINWSLDRMQIMLWVATVLAVIAGIVNWTYIFKLWRSR